jgi:VCBS repeat-containing protein
VLSKTSTLPADRILGGHRIRPWAVLGVVLGGASVAWAGLPGVDGRNVIAANEPIIFSVTGDIPYSSSEVPQFQQQIDQHDLYSPSEFLVHVGDIKSGSGTCSESYYITTENILKSSIVPCFIVPGDNETTDCSNPTQAWSYWTKHLLGIEDNWACTPPVERQSSRPENFAFVSKGMLFIGINLVGGSNASSVQNDDATWASQQLSGKKALVRGAVIFAQAGPGSGSTFFNQFVAAATSFGKPILYIHGDGHSWILDHPFSASNVTRVQVDNGGAALPVQVTATLSTSSMFQFNRTPWNSSSRPITRPPCGTPVNQAPVAANDSYKARVNTVLSVRAPGVLGNDTDSEGNALTAVLVAATTHGSLSLAANGSFTYLPGSDFSGADSFTYRASDGSLQSDIATVALTVSDMFTLGPVADAYVNSGSPTSNYGTNSEVRAKSSSSAYKSYLRFTVSGAGSIQSAKLRLFVTDPSPGGGSIHPVSNTYAASTTAWTETDLNWNNAPLISAPALATAGNAVTGTWVEWDVTAAVPGDGTYSLGLQGNSSDSVRYSSKEGTNPPQLVVAMATNHMPVGANDSYPVAEDSVLSVAAPGVLGNDTDADGDALTATLVASPAHGTFTLSGNGSFTYTPPANFYGPDSFTYRATDPKGANVTVTAALTVISVNDAPVAAADAYAVLQDSVLSVAAPGVLGNDTDIESPTLTAVLGATTREGNLSLASDGSFTYRPALGFSGTDRFTYMASDGGLQSDSTAVTFNIPGPIFTPIADAYVDSASATQNHGTDSALRAHPGVYRSYLQFVVSGVVGVRSAKLRLFVTEPSSSGGSLYSVADTYAGTTSLWTETGLLWSNAPEIAAPALATHGAVTLGTWAEFDVTAAVLGNGIYSFGLRSFGSDPVTYSSKEGTNPPQLVLTTGTAGAHNQPPVATNDSYTVAEDNGLSVAIPGVLGNDTDADGDALAAALVTSPAHGTFALNANGSFTYTPQANFYGSDGFTYRASDGKGGAATATAAITVTPVNDAPVAVADVYAVHQDSVLSVGAAGVLGNDTDIDSTPLTAVLGATTTQGSLSLASDGSFIYTPAPGFSGTDSFTYIASDGSLQSAVTQVTLNIPGPTLTPVADAWVDSSSATLNHGTDSVLRARQGMYHSYLQFVVSGVVGVRSAKLRLFVTNPSSSGGSVYRVADTYAGSTNLWTETGIRWSNAPVIAAPAVATRRLVPLGTWAEFDVTAAVLGNGIYSFGLRNFGTDPVAYCSKEGPNPPQLVLTTGTAGAHNHSPVVASDSYTVAEDSVLNVVSPGVLGNDSDPDGDALTAALVTGPAYGTFALSANGAFTYTPPANFNGSDGFTYRASDGKGGVATATVAITITPVDDAPVAATDTYSVHQDSVLSVAAPGVLGNDTDLDSTTLTAVLGATTTQGNLSLAADGSFTYTPTPGFSGTDSFTYAASDGSLQSAVTQVTLDIQGPTFTPIADAYVDSSRVMQKLGTDSALRASPGLYRSYFQFVVSGVVGVRSAKLRLFVTDPSSSGGSVYPVADTYAGSTTLWTETGLDWSNAPVISAPALATRGAVTLGTWAEFDVTAGVFGNGICSFGLQNFGSDPVAYSSREGTHAPQLVLTTGAGGVNNQPPVAANDSYTAAEDSVLSVAAPGVLGNDTDADGGALTTALITSPAHGTLALSGNGSFTYTPQANYYGSDAFTYRAGDGKGGTATATAAITVTGINDAPMAAADAYSVRQDSMLSVAAPGVLGNDTDLEGTTLTAVLGTTTAQGSLSLAADGSFTYTPNPGSSGPDSFTYTASDGSLQSAVTQVHLTVRPIPRVTFQEVRTGGSTAATTVATGTALTAVAGDLYLAAISSKSYAPVTGVSGLGLAWTRVRAQCAGRGQTGVEVWMARGTPSPGIVTATLSAAPNSAVIAVSRWSGADGAHPIATIVSGNSLGVDGLCSGGVDTGSFAFNLAVPAGGGTAFGAVAMRNRTLTPGAGYTKRVEVHLGSSGSEASVACVDQTAAAGTLRFDGSIGNPGDWAAIGLVLRPGTATAKPQLAAAALDNRPLYRLFPNPARGTVSILYELSTVTPVHASIYDVAGRRVRVLIEGSQSPGRRVLQWDGRDDAGHPAPSGVYFVHMQIGSHALDRKLVLQK